MTVVSNSLSLYDVVKSVYGKGNIWTLKLAKWNKLIRWHVYVKQVLKSNCKWECLCWIPKFSKLLIERIMSMCELCNFWTKNSKPCEPVWVLFPKELVYLQPRKENMSLFTRYKNNFKKQAWWIWEYKFVYSHPNSKHLEPSLCFPLTSAALLVAQAPSQLWIFLKKGRHVSGSVLVVCAHQPILLRGPIVSSIRHCVILCTEDTEAPILGTSERIGYVSANKILWQWATSACLLSLQFILWMLHSAFYGQELEGLLQKYR